jgi:hypothetical protein
MGGGGKSSGPTEQTVNQSNLPEYARPYFERLLDRTESVSKDPYQQYQGPRIAGFSQDQQAGFGVTREAAMGGAPDLDTARGAAGQATNAALGTTGFQSRDLNVGMFDNKAASNYMSPYMDQVIARQQAGAARDFREGQAGRDDAAIRQGAFGGYRQAISQGVAERGLSDRFANIEAEGRQAAFSNAQQQFERDRAAGFTADATNESNRARAAGVQQQGAALGLQGADSFSRLAAADQGLAFQRGEALQKIGQQQQGLEQQKYDLAASDFANQRDFGRQQLNFYSGILRGVPVTAQSEVSRYENPNPMNQLLGGGVAALGAYNQYMR